MQIKFSLPSILVAIAIAIAGTFYIVNRNSSTQLEEFRNKYIALQDTTTQVLALNKTLKDSVNILKNDVDRRDIIVDSLLKDTKKTKTSADKMRAQNDSLRQQLANSLPDTCKSALELADRYREEADTLRSVVTRMEAVVDSLQKNSVTLQGALALSEKRAENAERQLREYIALKPPKDSEKLFGIKLPSRVTTAVIAFGAGFIASEMRP